MITENVNDIIGSMTRVLFLLHGYGATGNSPGIQEIYKVFTEREGADLYDAVHVLNLYSGASPYDPIADYNVNTPIYDPKEPNKPSLARKILQDMLNLLPDNESGEVHLLAHSTGGITYRSIFRWLLEPREDGYYYLKNFKVTKLVLLAVPNKGTRLASKLFARFLHIGIETVFTSIGASIDLLEGKKPRKLDYSDGEINQLRYQSEFIKELNENGMLIPNIEIITAVGTGGRGLLSRYIWGRYLFGFIPTFLFPRKNDGVVSKESAQILGAINIYREKYSKQIKHSEIVYWISHEPTRYIKDEIIAVLSQ